MTYHPTKANLINPIEEITLVADTKAAKASNGDTTKSSLV
jgi:hypothetical protein